MQSMYRPPANRAAALEAVEAHKAKQVAVPKLNLGALEVQKEAVSPEERAASLAALPAEERATTLAALPAEERAATLSAMSPEDHTATLAAMLPEERAAALIAMSPKERAASLAAMSSEERAAAKRDQRKAVERELMTPRFVHIHSVCS